MTSLGLQRKLRVACAFSCMLLLQLITGQAIAQVVSIPAAISCSGCGGLSATSSCTTGGGYFANGWNGTSSWVYSLNTAGYSNIVMSFRSSSSGTGPTTGSIFFDAGSGDISTGLTYAATSCGVKGPFALPAGCNNISALRVKARMSSAAGTGTNRIEGSVTSSISPLIFQGSCSTPTIVTVSGASCTGSQISLNASQPWVSYALKRGATTVQTLTGTGGVLSFATGSTATMGTYTVLATSTAAGCSGQIAGMNGSVVINLASPVVTTSPSSVVVCAGDDVSFTASATDAVSYTWQKSTVAGGSTFTNITLGMDGGIYGATFSTPTLTITGAVAPVNNFNYRLVATNPCANVNSSAANLTVNNCNAITTTVAGYGPFCNTTSNAVSVDYTSVGTFTGTFQAELSDPTGSFTSPTVIGTGASPIAATIPAGVTPGLGYRIRVTNSLPAIVGSNNGSDIVISGTSAGGTTGSDQSICTGTTPGAISIAGHTGSVVKWQSATDAVFTTPNDIAGSAGVTTLPGATVGALSATTYFRAEVQSGVCAATVSAVTTVSIVSTPTIVSGATTVCAAASTTLSNGVAGGTWTSSNSAIGTIDAATGVLSGIAAGATVVAYSNGCAPVATTTVTVVDQPVAISGIFSVCEGAAVLVSNSVAGGTWSSNSTTTATVDATGLVTAGLAGTANIVYSTGCGLAAVQTITVVAAPGSISGVTSVCQGATIVLSNASAGGTWISSIPAVATISAAGAVGGVLPGSTIITYGTGCGSDVSATVTVITLPGVISGLSSLCEGSAITLSNPVSGGTWTSTNTVVATITLAGTVSGIVAGVSVIHYATGCGADATKTITVISAPAPIAGASTVCEGAAVMLTNSVAGGTWSSGNTTVATVNTGGAVTGIIAGPVTINYSTGCGTDVSKVVTVVAQPSSITGATSVCFGLTTQLSNAVAGGTWSSSVTNVATVDAVTGLVTAGMAGGVTISYATGCGVTPIHIINVIAAPSPIGGIATVCSGLTAQLSESVLGGTWTSSNTAVATVNTTGLVTAGMTGVAVVNYTTGCGAAVTHTITTISAPAAIGGAAAVCVGGTIQLSQSVNGGTWSTSNTAVATVSTTGLLTGLTANPVIVAYSTGCGTVATKPVSVISAPGTISGATSVCGGLGLPLSNTISGGTWSSNNLSIATVNTAGFVLSFTPGIVVIRYSTGCGSDATHTITAIATPSAIGGPATVCAGSIAVLNNSAVGGNWSSSNTSSATVDAFGVVSGVMPGQSAIRYSTGCGADASKTVTVLIAPAGIAGSSSVCIGGTLSLSNATAGGVWTSSTPSVATINGAGLVTSVASGTTSVTYATGCGADQVKVVTVVDVPGVISGASSVCPGATIALSNPIAGGGWNSNNNPVASVSATGNVTGGIAGTAVISYTTGCGTDASRTVTVIAIPATTMGTTSVCPGATSTLTNSATGGVWGSDNTTIATVNAAGLVTAIAPGTANIIYSTGCGANASVSFLVNTVPASPGPISGTTTVCFGNSTILSSFTAGGAWSTDNMAIATVDVAGIVYTNVAGTVNISYTVTNMCGSTSSSTLVTAEAPLTTVPAILGVTSFCEGTFLSVSNSVAGGVWSSSNTAVATISPLGLIAGVAAGNADIAYTIGNTCNSASATASLTVNPLPAPAPIIGSTAPFCAGTTIVMSDPTPGGVWSSNLTTIATVNSAGVVTGVSGGSSTIFYSLTNGCGTVASVLIVTVDPLPVLSPVMGGLAICQGGTTQLSDTASAGAWSSGNTTIAIVSSSGLVTGVGFGVVPVSYSVINSCGITAAVASVTVSTTPVLGPITGPATVCVGSSINLANTTPGGTWSTDVVAIANVNSLGVVAGWIPGIDTIRYSVANSCGTSVVAKGIEVLPASACDPTQAATVSILQAELKVFPNPTSGTFTWNLLSANNEPVDMVITNVVGKQVKSLSSTTNKENSMLLDVANGVYFLSVKTTGATYNARIIISK